MKLFRTPNARNTGLLLLLMTALAGCTRETGRKVVSYTFMAGSPAEVETQRLVIADFEKRNPDIAVKMIHIPPGGYLQKLLILSASGACPDVVFVNGRFLPTLASRGIFLDLDPLRERDREMNQDLCFPVMFDNLRFGDRLYALPRNNDCNILFYNKTLFDAAGVDYPNETWTWEGEFLDACRKLAADRNHDGRTDTFAYQFDNESWIPTLKSYGVELFNPEMTQCRMDDPRAIHYLQFLADLRNRWKAACYATPVDLQGAAFWSLFTSGRVAMMEINIAIGPTFREIRDFEWDVALPPAGPAGRHCLVEGAAFAIAATTRHPGEAWRLARYLSGEKGQRPLSEGGLLTPTLRALAAEPNFLGPAEWPPHNRAAFVAALDFAFMPYRGNSRWEEGLARLMPAVESVFAGRQRAEEALPAAARSVGRYLNEYR